MDKLPITHHEITLLKIDVEGYEKFVIQGGIETLKKTKCLFFESFDSHFVRYGYNCEDLFEMILKNGFQVFQIIQGGKISPIPRGYQSRKCENLLALRDFNDFLGRTSFQIEISFQIKVDNPKIL